tara:strand:- start:1000 stop:1713 length:714 start_codon:yes stop_codon:yes gene_type:complete
MGAFAGPNVIEDGLILALDAGNAKSYPGSGTTWTDLIGINNASLDGSVYSSFGGGSIEFDGTDDFVDLNGKTYIGSGEIETGESNGNYTLEAWINVRSSQGTTTNADSIIGNTSSHGVGMQVGVSGGNPRINYGARSTSNFYSSQFSYNTWTHVCLSRIAGTSVRSYLNGQFDTSTGTNNLEVTTGESYSEMRIGNSSSRVTGYYDGYISIVRIYKIGLTDEQVQQNYNALRGRFGL